MKNRRRIIVAFMLCAVMLLGIGYAALTDTLTIAGQANVSTDKANAEFDADVYFHSAAATSSTGTSGSGDTATVLTDTDRASFTVNSLALGGEQAVFTFVVYNVGNHVATLSAPTIVIRDLIADGEDNEADNDNVFTVTTSWDTTTLVAGNTTKPGEAVLTVTVQLYDSSTNPEHAITGYFDISFTATAA